jgi:hypothetical protein
MNTATEQLPFITLHLHGMQKPCCTSSVTACSARKIDKNVGTGESVTPTTSRHSNQFKEGCKITSSSIFDIHGELGVFAALGNAGAGL